VTLPLLAKSHPDILTAQRRIAETVNNILTFQHDDSRIRTAAEIAAGVTPVNYAYAPYFLLRYVPTDFIPNILNGTSTDDVTVYLQACCDAAAATGRPQVVTLPGGLIVISFLNLTNTRDSHTKAANGLVIQRDGLILQGAGVFNTVIQGSPGKNKAIIECSQSQGLQIRDINLVGVSGQCGAGIYTGVSSVNVAYNSNVQQKFERLYITIPSDATANGGNGTVAFWNFGGEDSVHTSQCTYTADISTIFTAHSAVPFPYSSPVNALLSDHSCGDNLVSASLFSLANGPALITTDVGKFNFDGFISGSGGAASAGHLIQGAYVGGKFSAIVEAVATALDIQGTFQSSTYNVELGTGVSGNCIRLRDTSAILGSEIRLFLTQSVTKQLLAADVATNTTVSSTSLKDVWFHTNLDKAYILNGDIQFTGSKLAYILPNCSDVHFRSSDYEYDIFQDRHELRVPQQVTTLTGGASPGILPLVKVVTPAAGIANQQGVGAVLEFNGQLNSSAANGNSWGARIQEFLPFYADFSTAAITLGTASGSVLAKVVQTPASFDITSCGITGTIASNVITMSMTIGRSGAATTSIFMRGVAVLWQDYTSVAGLSLAL
jgi:hypothetical protein